MKAFQSETWHRQRLGAAKRSPGPDFGEDWQLERRSPVHAHVVSHSDWLALHLALFRGSSRSRTWEGPRLFWFTSVRSAVALEPFGPIQARPDPTRRPRRNTTYLQRPKKSRAASNGWKSGTQELHLRGLTSKTEAAAAESELLLPRTARTRCSPTRRKG